MRQISHIDDLFNDGTSQQDRIVEAMTKMKIIEDLQQSRSKTSSIYVAFAKGVIDITMNIKIPVKKLIIVVGGMMSILGLAAKIILDNWPTIRTLSK